MQDFMSNNIFMLAPKSNADGLFSPSHAYVRPTAGKRQSGSMSVYERTFYFKELKKMFVKLWLIFI